MEIIGKPQKLNTGEMVARRDQNGNYCAAIQMVSDMDGFSYDSFDGIVGDILDNPGEDIVYLTKSERVLKIFRIGYEPLQIILSDHGVVLKEREIWQIKIAGNESADVLPVTFRFTPTDASLFIDGKTVGKELTQNLSIGKHQIRLEKTGYQAIEKTVTVNEKQVFFEWQMEKVSDAGLQITTTPAGAVIFLDGVKLGESPVSAFYPPGTYPIKITKDGCISIENEMLEVKLPQTTKSYTLDDNVGQLTINTRPEATVYFNEEPVSNPQKVKLSPQLVKIKVTMPKAADLEQQIVLKKDDDIVLDMYPDIQVGTLQVAVTPFDAKIELTGDAGEKHTVEGMKIFEEIPVGTYTIKVSAAGYTTVTETATVKQAEIIKKTINLAKPNADNASTGVGTTISADGLEMILVTGGTFTMGCASEQGDCETDEKPTHQVTVSDFYIGKYEVSQEQWREVMGASTSFGSAHQPALSSPSYFKDCDDCPVEMVSWDDVQEFIKKLNQKTGKEYRLPTEAEWEYASRGGAKSDVERSRNADFKYAGSNNIDEVAWYDGNSGSKTHQVGLKKPNELDIHDMSGNVWEWCSDWYGNYSSGSQTNPQGSSSGSYRVLRGGSWSNLAGDCRVPIRIDGTPDGRYHDGGFRLACSP
ncbi:MAG TPA: SUMF1/EgtB/PvdO family nonheme iron enzyme [Bacteroidales bacterium]|nr:SUMF1/EgtB/PvdO family nonheme iron enzyme [Bacteroidales bacterium]